MPACRTGLYALKISRGTVDDTGVQPANRDFDSLGGFARSVSGLAYLVAIMQGKQPEAYLPLPTSWDGLKIGFVDPTKWRSYPSAIEPVDGFFEQTDTAMFAAQDKIRGLGGKVVSSIPLLSFDEIIAAMPDLEYMEDLNRKYLCSF
jgi:amidase